MERYITSSPKNNNKLSLVARKRIITQIYRGLSYIHSKGYLHRDIGIWQWIQLDRRANIRYTTLSTLGL